jgi:hypothetical protein
MSSSERTAEAHGFEARPRLGGAAGSGDAGARSIGLLALLAGLTIVAWSLLFRTTFDYTFFWDDYHFIRCYTPAELRSTFHGPNDPDGIETPALRPVATLLFHVQGCLFGENVRLQRGFMAVLSGILLWSIGLLLREAGLAMIHTAIVFLLLASSRVFACLVLWMTLGSLVLTYTLMVLAAFFYLRWTGHGRKVDLALLAITGAIAVFTREEAYTLPFALPLLWLLCRHRRLGDWRRAAVGAAAAMATVSVHVVLRARFIQRPPGPRWTIGAAERVLRSVGSAWCPGGLELRGSTDWLLGIVWRGFLCSLALAMVFASVRGRAGRLFWCCSGICVLGVLLCAPALAIDRSFGVALPSVAFSTAVAVAIGGVPQRLGSRPSLRRIAVSLALAGLAVGVAAGIRRGQDVADSMHPNCVSKVLRDGRFLFNRAATIPPERRRSGLARLAAAGIRSPEDLAELERDTTRPRPFYRNRATRSPFFLTRYDYLFF